MSTHSIDPHELAERGITPKELKLLRRSNLIEGLEPDEEVVCVIHRHPMGLILLYIVTVIAFLSAVSLIAYIVPQTLSEGSTITSNSLAAFSVIVLALIAIIGLLVATYVYGGNRLIITNKNVTQILQRSLFVRKVSELSMSNVEDVSASQEGILQSLFGYGTLRIQTAGEMENFIFIYCPRPNFFGRIVSEARQEYADSLTETSSSH